MKPLFHPQLVNGVFGDPALYVDLQHEPDALLMDLGDIAPLAPRKILRLSHVFVSHAHMDHFAGLDRLVRLFLGRPGRLHLYGPPGFVAQVGHRLAGYTWNLVHNYDSDFTLVVTEVDEDGNGARAEFHTRHAFVREHEQAFVVSEQVLVKTARFQVRYTALDHIIPSLAFAVEEERHVNVLKARLDDLGLPVGPWLHGLKRLCLEGADDERTLQVPTAMGERTFTLAALRHTVRIVPGQRLVYVADCAGHEDNLRRIDDLAAGADVLCIEAAFLAQDAAEARRKHHLTARQAGEAARRAGVRRVIPFHFSARYAGEEQRLRAELETAFHGVGELPLHQPTKL